LIFHGVELAIKLIFLHHKDTIIKKEEEKEKDINKASSNKKEVLKQGEIWHYTQHNT